MNSERSHVLLTLHARAGRWFQTGGHCEPEDSSLGATALREAQEESGITDLTLDPTPRLLSRHAVKFCSPVQSAHHLDVQFRAIAPQCADIHISSESIDVAWWPIDHLPEGTDEVLADLVRVCAEST